MSDISDSDFQSDEELVDPPSALDPYRSLGSWSSLRGPELIVPEAFHKGPFRIPAQLAAATDTPLERVLATFDEIFGGTHWRDDPALTPRDILSYAEQTKVSVYMYLGRRLHTFVQRETCGTAIVFTSWCGLAYLYKGMGPRARDDAQRSSQGAAPRPQRAMLEKSIRHPPKPVEDFQEFPWHLELADVPAGPYWIPSCWDRGEGDPERTAEGLLKRFLLSRRYPMIDKRHGTAMPNTLTYQRTPSMDRNMGGRNYNHGAHAREGCGDDWCMGEKAVDPLLWSEPRILHGACSGHRPAETSAAIPERQ